MKHTLIFTPPAPQPPPSLEKIVLELSPAELIYVYRSVGRTHESTIADARSNYESRYSPAVSNAAVQAAVPYKALQDAAREAGLLEETI